MSNQTLATLLSTLGSSLSSPHAIDLVSAFERHARQLLGATAVRLRELPVRHHARLVTPTRTADSLVVGVPSADPRLQAVLEASFDSGGDSAGGQDNELLSALAHLGGLVLEASRGTTSKPAAVSDGAAPLIGSSVTMRGVRERLERVAQTDFAVLIEGPIGRM